MDRTAEDGPEQWRSPMVDVSGMSPADLHAELAATDSSRAGADGSVLAKSLRRLTDDLARPGEPIAGFNSAL